jgi:hypothetical protein
MNIKNGLVFFISYLFPPLVLLFGLIGNSLGLILLLNKDLINIGPRDTYRYLLISDSIYLLQIIVSNLEYSYDLNLSTLSNVSCKLWNYFNYSLAPISSWLIVYISLDRCISIQKPKWRFTLRNRRNQFIFFLIVLIICLFYYLPVGFYYEKMMIEINSSNESLLICGFINSNSDTMLSYMDGIFRAVIPFFLMLLFNLILIYALIASRKRIVENFLAEENQTFYKEIRLSFCSILMTLIYIILQAPVSITITVYKNFNSELAFQSTLYLFYMSYAINFYIILATNSLFRLKFIQLFRLITRNN